MYRFTISDPHFLPHAGCEVEITLNEGELLTIVGENGIGKSTLVKRIFQDNPENKAVVEQTSMDFFYDRKLEVVRKLFLQHEGVNKSYFDHLWKTFQLDQKENRFQSTLSGGESQALKLSLGLSLEKPLFILDEPSQYLDESSKSKLNNVLQMLLQNSKSILMIEHDLGWLKTPAIVSELIQKDGILKRGKTWNI